MPAVGSLLTAVETNTRSPQTIGLDTATPGTGVFQSTSSPVGAFQVVAAGAGAVGDARGLRSAERRPVLRRGGRRHHRQHEERTERTGSRRA